MCNGNLYKHFSVTESERLMSELFGEVTICSLILNVMCKQNNTILENFEGSGQLELPMVAGVKTEKH